MAESEREIKPKPRPIIRIGLFLISHSLLVSVVCCTAGILALLLLPVLAKNTYISENALMPGSASPMLSNNDASDGQRFLNRILNLDSKTTGTDIEIPEVIAEHIMELGGEVSYHKFQPVSNKFHPLHFFLGPDAGIIHENYSCSSYGINTVGIIRAPRGDGKEAIVMVTPYNSVRMTMGEALSLGVAHSVFSLLSRVTWLAKDIIWLAADSKHGEYAAVAAWLRDYNTLSFGDVKLHPEMCGASIEHEMTQVKGDVISNGFRRAGTMAAALVIKVADCSTEFEKDVLKIYAEASNGQMPNLDLINIVNYLAVHGQSLQVRVEKIWSLLDSWLLNSLGELIELLGNVAKSLNPQWKFGIPVADYVEGSATLASSLYNQALGVPTGPHGAFRDYQVDAITMEISPKFASSQRVLFLLLVGRLVEGVIRSVNNLLEKFHQSFFLYLLTSSSRFVSVGVYMIAFALLIAPLPLVAAALFSDASKSKLGKDVVPSEPALSDESVPTFTSWKWLYAAKAVLVVHLWSAIVTLLPYFLCQIPNSSPSFNLSMWILLSVISLFLTYWLFGSFSFPGTSQPQRKEWALLKSVTVAAAFIGLCLMSVINFATAEIGALLLVPMCLTIVPLRLDIRVNTMKALLRGACNVLLVFFGFPPTAFLLLKGALEGYDSIRFGDFWTWAETLWAWNSATYIYICMVHLPCWVLCIHTLLHHC
ncbi:Glycosylphosphatidylinositol anchor attachment protein GAA1 [Handroanthus impetiginosus]|uniref:Glycosylphosphatidylinositol anchor attachment protein GAA1 n=1 Tax=Handroanthus impetiginosus TaxID=429701 RepID=A0A2G9GXW0_9LAMI|nr:Glycosylphosphatidylinositol anchor attachment protein GAA1 [Handroanthus impetiginosus]